MSGMRLKNHCVLSITWLTMQRPSYKDVIETARILRTEDNLVLQGIGLLLAHKRLQMRLVGEKPSWYCKKR